MAAARLAGSILVAITLIMTGPRVAAAADQPLLLEVTVNGSSTGTIGEFVLRDDALFAKRGELNELGLRVPDDVAPTPDGLVPVAALPGVTARLDQSTQTLNVSANNDRLLPSLLRAGGIIGGIRPVESDIGATLNYDVTDTAQGRRNVASGLFDARAFSPWGVASSGLLAYAGASPTSSGSYSAIRLDSSYVYSDPETLRRYRLGDTISSSLPWTRSVRLGGAQILSDFSMRPDLVTFPLPTIGSSVAVPSTVDVLVNGTQFLSRQVQPGPFQVPQLPIVNGAGTVSLSVTNALGQQVVTTLPFYASGALLAPGLQTYSAEIGAVRHNWGALSNDYGNPAGSGTYRRGLTPDLTIEGHTEGTAGQFMAGAGLVANIFDLGVANMSVAGSTASGRSGEQLAIGAQRIDRFFSLGASAIVANRGFRDVAAVNGAPIPRRQLNGNASVSFGRFGSIAVAYTAVDFDAAPAPVKLLAPNLATASGSGVVTFVPAQRAHVLSASYSVQVLDVSLYATGFSNFTRGGGSGVLLGVTVPIGPRSSVGASASRASGGSYAQLQAQQSAVTIGDWGYQVYGASGNPAHEFANVQYKSPWALVSAGADRNGRETTVRTEAQGALSFADGGLFPSNTISDSFAVVDTGVEGVRVLYENREIDRTDSAGRVLVPDLRSFDINHLAIEPTDLPVDATAPYTTREVRPPDRSGVIVKFPIQQSRGALLRLVDGSGKPLPVGSAATLKARGIAVPVGYDGATFVEQLSGDNELSVELPDGRRCAVRFEYRPAPGEIPVIGPLPCRDAAQ